MLGCPLQFQSVAAILPVAALQNCIHCHQPHLALTLETV